MPDNPFTANSFGIQGTDFVGNYEAAEEFLSSGEEEAVAGDSTKLEKITKTPVATPKKPLKKKKEDEDEEEEEEEEKEPAKPLDPLAEIEDDTEAEAEEEEAPGDDDDDDEEETEDEEVKPAGKTKKDENSYVELYKDMLNLGVFTQKEGEQPAATGQELLARFQEEGQMRATQWLDDYLGRFGDDRKELFRAIFMDGVDPEEYIPVYNQVQKMEGLDLTVEDNQKRVYREYYSRLGWDADKIEKRLQRTIDNGGLEEEVPDLHELLISQDKQAMADMEAEQQNRLLVQQRQDQEYKTGIQKTLTEALKNKEIKGIPITEKRAREAFDFLYTPKYKTPNGQLLTEFDKFILESKRPENLQTRILISLLQLDGFDFKNIKKQAISEESKELFNSLATKVTKDKARATKGAAKSSGSEWSNF